MQLPFRIRQQQRRVQRGRPLLGRHLPLVSLAARLSGLPQKMWPTLLPTQYPASVCPAAPQFALLQRRWPLRRSRVHRADGSSRIIPAPCSAASFWRAREPCFAPPFLHSITTYSNPFFVCQAGWFCLIVQLVDCLQTAPLIE